MIRKPPPPPSSVCVDVPDGLGAVEVAGDADGSLLLLAGDPALLEAGDGCGSLGRLAARAGAGAPGIAEVRSLAAWLGAPGLVPDPVTGLVGPPDPGRLRPLLSLLAPGRYVMTAEVAPDLLRVVRPGGRRTEGRYADEELALVTTDFRPPSDHAAVRRYGDLIRAGGALPALVVLFPTVDSRAGYLLDGHHKLAAYERAGARPLFVGLAPQTPRPPRPEELDRAREVFPYGPHPHRNDPLERVFSAMGAEASFSSAGRRP
ncbi:hypothetical protein [Streptomyces sp. NPDC008265]|uniref:hypothetical protein n=1 Tax=Streptomyces sp. NPDC008265 TaxID=3364824 RepID=UPI0036ED21DB